MAELVHHGSDLPLERAITETVNRRFTSGTIAKVEVLTDGDFDFDDLRLVEIRVIFKGEIDEVSPKVVGAVRDDLYGLLAISGDPRTPLLRMISQADYDGPDD